MLSELLFTDNIARNGLLPKSETVLLAVLSKSTGFSLPFMEYFEFSKNAYYCQG